MAYKQKTIYAGRTMEIERYHDLRAFRGTGETRARRMKPTPEAKEKQNRKMAERKLRRIMNANFTNDSWYLTMDCIREEGQQYLTPEEMHDLLSRFQRKLRAEYRRRGADLRYVSVMAIGTRSARHFHLVLSELPGVAYKAMRELIQGTWDSVYLTAGRKKRSFIHLENLYGENYGQLAAYFIKQSETTKQANGGDGIGRRWNSSKNLKKPVVKVKEILSAKEFRRSVKAPKGWHLDEEYTEISADFPDYDGPEFIRYILIRDGSGGEEPECR